MVQTYSILEKISNFLKLEQKRKTPQLEVLRDEDIIDGVNEGVVDDIVNEEELEAILTEIDKDGFKYISDYLLPDINKDITEIFTLFNKFSSLTKTQREVELMQELKVELKRHLKSLKNKRDYLEMKKEEEKSDDFEAYELAAKEDKTINYEEDEV